MRIAVVGPGAIGLTFGAAAAQAGHEVARNGVIGRVRRRYSAPTPVSDVVSALLAAASDAAKAPERPY